MSGQKAPKKQTRETEQLTELLSLLHLALKNIQLYPAGHNLVKNRLSIAHQLLHKILISRQTLLFGIARNIITFEETPLGESLPACSALATILSRHEIASMKFSYGVSQHSLFLFLKAVGILPEQKRPGVERQQDISSLDIPHISIELINYGYFDRKAGEESETNTESTAPLTWLTFTQKLTSGILGHSGIQSTIDASNFDATAPETLAAAINSHVDKQPKIIQQFATLLDQMLQQSSGETQPASSFGGKELNRIMTSLNPELRDQFLTTTLERCDRNMKHSDPEKILDKFSDSIVLNMVEQVNKKNVRISPALLNLIEKLSKMRFKADPATSTSIAERGKLDNLLDPDKYNQQVEQEYHNSLSKLARSPASGHPVNPDFPLEEYIETLKEDHLNRQIIHATLIIMDKSDLEEEYTELSHKLMEISLLLPDSGAYDLLQTVFKVLKQQTSEKKSVGIRKIAGQCIQELTASDFLDYIYSMFPEASVTEQQEAIAFLELLCPDILGKLLKIFCMKPTIPENDPLVGIFRTFRMETLSKIFTILPKTTAVNIKRLLVVVRYLGIQGTVRLLQPFLDHKNSDIRMQILDLLLPAHDEEALATLISMLESKNDQIVDAAIELCNTHHPPACVPHLLQLLEYQFFKNSAFERNQKLFLILGHIGDKKALPSLKKIAFTKWPFQRQKVTQMKRILFYSLKGYHPEHRINLLHQGIKIKDDEIHKICNALLPAKERDKTP